MKRFLNLVFVLALVLGLAALTGCGGEEKKAEPKAEQAVEQTAEQAAPAKKDKQFLAFGGGPTGGTFNFFANKMASIIAHTYDYLDMSPKGSGGSAENLRTLDKASVDFGIVYSGDAYLGRAGLLVNDTTKYENVRGISFLYGAPAQLVVRKDSGINSAYDLEGKIVAVGNPGSGAALSAERFFKHIGVWEKMEARNLGYSQAAADFSDNKIDAFWVLVGYPNSSIIEAATRTPVILLDLNADAEKSGFYDAFPFYSPVEIPAGTYEGQEAVVKTFQDSALWCASAKVDDDVVYDSLTAVYAEQGLKDMVTAHKAAKNMSIENGIAGVSVPLHPGAIKFWTEKGLTIPDNLK
ncbi:MAG: TAXI family TRAP transporter solute-binding subunit [Desulfovibrionaceae bacterium]